MLNLRYRSMYWYQRFRIIKFRFLSNCRNVEGRPVINQPVQMVGQGKIRFNGSVYLGVFPSPHWLDGYTYIEARLNESVIQIEDGVYISNNCVLFSDGPGIFIGKHTMLGWNCEILDSDVHDTHREKRMDGIPKRGKVVIGENVMIGPNVIILKGVRIGDNSVISNGTVITRSIPANTLVYGNPARGGRLFDSARWTARSSPAIKREK
jgi:acetyltransferase-like isoleucine patch superfamily enzyme